MSLPLSNPDPIEYITGVLRFRGTPHFHGKNGGYLVYLHEEDRLLYAQKLLSLHPDPIPRYVIYRELLGYDKDHPDCLAAYEAMLVCPQVERITAAQNEWGFWEPFHGTTEGMIRRLLSCGFDVTHPTLAGVQDYLIGLLEGRMKTGQYERQDHPLWYSEMFEPLIAAAMLSLLSPNHALVQKHRGVWAVFAEEIFAGGFYEEEHDRAVKAKHFGFKVQRPIPPFSYYCLLLTAPVGGVSVLSEKTDRALVRYCMTEMQQLYYVYNEPPGIPVPIDTHRRDSRDFWHWIRALSIIAPYKGFDDYAGNIGDYILSQRNADGLWRFPQKFDFALSDRYAGKCKCVDSSLFVLRFLCGRRGF